MKKLILIGAGVALLAGGGIAMAQMPPGAPDGAGPGGSGPHEHMEMMRHMHHPSGAGFRFRKGDTEIGIRCPSNETVQACVTAAGTLIDKVAGMQPKTP